MDIRKYLERIRYNGGLEPDLDLLKKLQKAHLVAVPFENLDIHYRIPILLDTGRIFEKVVLNRRGGFCYELNGLFCNLLLELGYNARRISARVYKNEEGYSPEFDHLVILVNIADREYLVDVGFGEFAFGPLELVPGQIQDDERGRFSIDSIEEGYFRVNKIDGDHSTPVYIFKPIAREFSEFEHMCAYHQTDPRSHFMQQRLISLALDPGRITISGNTLKIMNGNSTTEEKIHSEEAFDKLLWDIFMIRIKNQNNE